MIRGLSHVYERFLVEESIFELEGDSASLADNFHLIGHSDILLALACKPLLRNSVNVNSLIFCRSPEVRIECLLLVACFIITAALSCDVIGVLSINLAFVQGSRQMLIQRTTHSLSSLWMFLNINLEDILRLMQWARGLFIS